jgi:hypothetical protein
MQRIHGHGRSLLDAALLAIALLLGGSGLLFFFYKWLDLARWFEDLAFLGVYAAAGAFALFLAFAFSSVFISYLAGLFRKRGDGQPPA